MNIGASIGEFNAESENVQSYEERVECFFIANDITDEKKETGKCTNSYRAKDI